MVLSLVVQKFVSCLPCAPRALEPIPVAFKQPGLEGKALPILLKQD